MRTLTITPQKLQGTVAIPPSKSMAHRAIICAALAKGISKISHIDYSDDMIATIEGMRALKTLLETNNVTDTAMALGFSTPNYFSAVFKRYTTLSPSEFYKNK